MEYRKNMMKTSLSENLRVLMTRKMFDKITIKQICDETGVIRATFYNYFEDKYDCLNWIVYTDLVSFYDRQAHSDFGVLIEHAMRNVEENIQFYRVAYQVTGQNSFEDMIRHNLSEALLTFFDQNRKADYLPQYSNELLASYYAEGMAFVIRNYVHDNNRQSISDVKKMILDLMNHSFTNFI